MAKSMSCHCFLNLAAWESAQELYLEWEVGGYMELSQGHFPDSGCLPSAEGQVHTL